MSNGIGIAPVAAGNSGNNLTMLEAVSKDLEKKEEDEKKAEAKSAPAADKVSLSTDAKEAAKEAARTEIRGLRKRLSSARKEMRVVSHDLKHMGADEKAVKKTLIEATHGLREKAVEKNQQARADVRSKKISRHEYMAIRLRSATEQMEGIVGALKGYRDQLNKTLAATQTEKEAPKADLTENVSANINGDGKATGKVEEKDDDEKVVEKAAEKGEKDNGGNEKILKSLEEIEKSLNKLIGKGNGSLFSQLAKLSAKIDKLEKIFMAAFGSKSMISAQMGVLEGSIDSLLPDKRKAGTGFIIQQNRFGYGVTTTGIGGAALHMRGSADGTRSGFIIGGAGGVGMGAMGQRAQNANNPLPSLLSAMARSKLSVVA